MIIIIYHCNLKSSLDRFIDNEISMLIDSCTYLKSSLDRFIVENLDNEFDKFAHLKSSLDRFIAQRTNFVTSVYTI